MTGSNERESRAYRAGAAIAVVASFLTVWTTIVRDDGTGAGSFMLILAAAVGGFSAWFQPAGMARAMLSRQNGHQCPRWKATTAGPSFRISSRLTRRPS